MRIGFAMVMVSIGCHADVTQGLEVDARPVPVDAHCDLASAITGAAYGHTFGPAVAVGFTPEIYAPDNGKVQPLSLLVDDGVAKIYIFGLSGQQTGKLTVDGVDQKAAKAEALGVNDRGCYRVTFSVDFMDGGHIAGSLTPPEN